MTFTEVNGLTYFSHKAGQGPPLLMLHGFTGSSQSWDRVSTDLARTHHVLMIDLPGHGQTDSPTNPDRYRMEAVAADIEQLLNRFEIPTCHLLGYSMGGRLALYLALTRPSRWRSLILESASPGLASEDERRARITADNALAGRIENQPIEAFIDYWENIPLFASQQQLPAANRQALRRQRVNNNPTGLANSLRGMGTGQQPSLRDDLKDLNLPVLLLAGELDSKFVGINKMMAQGIPDVQLRIIPDAGHTIHLERPEVFTQAVVQYLAHKDEVAEELTGAE